MRCLDSSRFNLPIEASKDLCEQLFLRYYASLVQTLLAHNVAFQVSSLFFLSSVCRFKQLFMCSCYSFVQIDKKNKKHSMPTLDKAGASVTRDSVALTAPYESFYAQQLRLEHRFETCEPEGRLKCAACATWLEDVRCCAELCSTDTADFFYQKEREEEEDEREEEEDEEDSHTQFDSVTHTRRFVVHKMGSAELVEHALVRTHQFMSVANFSTFRVQFVSENYEFFVVSCLLKL